MCNKMLFTVEKYQKTNKNIDIDKQILNFYEIS